MRSSKANPDDLDFAVAHQGYLRLVRLSGAWRLQVERSDDVFLYVVLAGSCVFEMAGVQPILLQDRAVLNLLRGRPHVVRSSAGGAPAQDWGEFTAGAKLGRKPGDAAATLLVGRMPSSIAPDLHLLPAFLHIGSQESNFWQIALPVARALEFELARPQSMPRSDGIVRRLVETLAMIIDRHRIVSDTARFSDNEEALRERLTPLIRWINAEPQHDWTVSRGGVPVLEPARCPQDVARSHSYSSAAATAPRLSVGSY